MDVKAEETKERIRRPVRSKRYNRRVYGEERRPPKRLFTPEIKRYLKDWLVRRRDNPYPNRDEKKTLAVQTGLTYIQVCNWFANWRRKLKNAGSEPQRKTWGNLIKTYNSQVQGNVEHFSICSEDSIWEETEDSSNFEDDILANNFTYQQNGNCNNTYKSDYPYKIQKKYIISKNNNNNDDIQNQCYYVSSTTEMDISNPFAQPANKYKSHIMEKYLRDCQQPNHPIEETSEDDGLSKPSMITKWLESAANFKPNENSYLDWTFTKTSRKKTKNNTPVQDYQNLSQIHGKEELDAAEALTALANARYSNL